MTTDRTAPTSDTYDVVVVGAGFGGLSAAALLARSGRKVLLLDGQDGPGGVAHSFRRGPYTFDPAVHVTGQARPGLPFDLLLKILGVADRVEWLPLESLYGVVLPDLATHVPVGREGFIEAHARHFPAEVDGLRAFVDVMATVTRESQELPAELGLGALDQAVERYPTLFAHRNRTVSEVVDAHLADPRLRSLVAASWPYLGLPPDQLSFFSWSGMMMSTLDDGPSFVRGGFQSVADAFVAALERHGGEFVPTTWVQRILVEDGRVTGVDLGDDRVVRTGCVVSNASARTTFTELVGREHLPGPFLKRLERLQPSLSAVVVYAATTHDLAAAGADHETFLHRHWDPAEIHRDILAGRPGGTWMNVPTIVDPTLAPEGEHLAIISSLAPFDLGRPWREERDRYTEAVLDQVDRAFEGFRDGLTHVETATPDTFVRFARLEDGAIYAWANTPRQAGTGRPRRQTPIEGLHLAGAWTQPGTGSFRSVYSGLLVAMEITGHRDLGSWMDGMLREEQLIGPPVPATRSMAVLGMVTGIWQTQLVHVAAKLGIADLLAQHGPLSAERLAELTATHPRSLYRVLRALSTLGILDENERHHFRLTPLGHRLRSDVEGSVRHLAIMFGEPWHWESWGNLLHSVRTGEPAFEHTFGMGTYEYVTVHPEAAEVYDRAMTDITMQAAPAVAEHYPFGEVKTLMDVGGGHGTLLNVILRAHPHLQGILYDLPHVVAGAHEPLAEAGLSDRCQVVGGDVFAGVPEGADAIMAKSFIHSFDDDTAVELLTRFRQALPPEGGRVLVVEMVLPDDHTPSFGKLFDIEMLTQSDDGRDRTEGEFRELFARAGLRLTRVVDTTTPVSVIEGVPA